jgi:hypothetical protein
MLRSSTKSFGFDADWFGSGRFGFGWFGGRFKAWS